MLNSHFFHLLLALFPPALYLAFSIYNRLKGKKLNALAIFALFLFISVQAIPLHFISAYHTDLGTPTTHLCCLPQAVDNTPQTNIPLNLAASFLAKLPDPPKPTLVSTYPLNNKSPPNFS